MLVGKKKKKTQVKSRKHNSNFNEVTDVQLPHLFSSSVLSGKLLLVTKKRSQLENTPQFKVTERVPRDIENSDPHFHHF